MTEYVAWVSAAAAWAVAPIAASASSSAVILRMVSPDELTSDELMRGASSERERLPTSQGLDRATPAPHISWERVGEEGDDGSCGASPCGRSAPRRPGRDRLRDQVDRVIHVQRRERHVRQ